MPPTCLALSINIRPCSGSVKSYNTLRVLSGTSTHRVPGTGLCTDDIDCSLNSFLDASLTITDSTALASWVVPSSPVCIAILIMYNIIFTQLTQAPSLSEIGQRASSFSNCWLITNPILLSLWKVNVKALVTQSCPTHVTPWTVASRAALSMEFSRQGYWSRLPFPSSRDPPKTGIESSLPHWR